MLTKPNIANANATPMKVLVVDDTTVNRQILRVFLERLGFIFLAAEDGDQAVAIFQRERPDIVLMDVMMPQVNGYEATRRIRELSGERWVPVIFISALERDENLIDGLEAGGDDFMSKPLNFIVLDAKLRSLRRMVELQQRLEETRRRSAAITENIVDGVVTIDNAGLIQSVNSAVTRIFGYRDSEMLGQHIYMLMPEEEITNYEQCLSACLQKPTPSAVGHTREMQARRKSGESFSIELGISAVQLQGQTLFVGILRDITERKQVEQRLRDNAERLQAYREHQEREHVLTREIVERQMTRPGLADPWVRYWVEPAADFSGDIVAAARSGDGKLFAMLSDGCGHGLAPAISVMPVLTTFYGLLETGVANELAPIIGELNRQLYATLPRGRFVASAVFCLNPATRTADLWVGGIPTVLWLGADRRIKQRFASTQLSLGIVETDDELLVTVQVSWVPGDTFIACSDGLFESPTRSGEALGVERFIELVARCQAHEDLLPQIQALLRETLAPVSPSDDISILIVECRT